MLSQALELFPAYFCRPQDRSVAENTPALVGSWTRCWILLKSVSCLILARVLFGSLVSTWIPKCQGQRRKYRGFVLLLDWWRSSFILFMENRNKLFGQSNIYAWRREWQPTPAWWATVGGVTKELDTTEWLTHNTVSRLSSKFTTWNKRYASNYVISQDKLF